ISYGVLLIQVITQSRLLSTMFGVIDKLTQLTANSDIEQSVVEGGLGCSAACVSNASEMNCGGDRRAIGQSPIRVREGIKRICDWHTNAVRTQGSTVCLLEWIREEPSSRPDSIKK